MKHIMIVSMFALGGCATTDNSISAAEMFFQNMTSMCGKSFAGTLAAGDASDASFANADMRAHVRGCSATEIRIAFDVGEDRSRTWIITRTEDGVRLKHRHMMKDGTEDPVSQYGGDTVQAGTAMRQEFPADAYSKMMFTKEGRTVSNSNVWAFEIEPKRTLTYELARPGRLFRVSFDLGKPLSGATE